MKITKIVALALLFSSASYAQTLQSAIKKTENERFTEAIKEFKTLIVAEPSNANNYFYLGECFFAQNELDSALVYWNSSAVNCPLSPIGMVGQGKYHWFKKEEAQAKEQFTLALNKTKNKNPEIIRNIAKTYITSDNKNLDEAIILLESAIKLDGKNEDSYLLLGDALNLKTPENGSPAIKNYNKALEVNPMSPRGIIRVGVLYKRAQSYEEAKVKYLEAQRIDPTFAPAYRENAELHMLFNKNAVAIEEWKKYLELNNSVEARYRYTVAMYKGKMYCEVIPEIESYKSEYNNYYVEKMLANSYAECTTAGDAFNKGMAASEAFLKMAPADKIFANDYRTRAQLYLNAQKDSLAILEFEKAGSMDEKVKLEIIPIIAKMAIKNKNYAKVIEYYEYKMSKGALSPSENYELGKAYYIGPKNFVLADSAFARVTRISSTYVPGHFWRGRANFQLDPTNEKWLALPYYQKALELIKVEERATSAYKAMTLESAKYIANYYTFSTPKDLVKAKEFWTIVQTVEPADADAKAFFAKNK